MRIIGVDIGNSGFRASELDLAADRVVPLSKLRWRHGDTESRINESRFRPDSDAWLSEIAELLADQQSHWFVSSVRRDAREILTDALAKQKIKHKTIRCNDLNMQFQVTAPEKVGIDRLLAAYAADERTDEDLAIVIQAGSALTVDLVERTPHAPIFRGGAIVPGVPMMLRLLGQGADMLPQLDADDLTDLPELPGRNSEQAMLCGASSALIGGALHLIHRYRSDFKREAPVILSGGDGTRLAPYLPAPVVEVPDLVLLGLLRLAREIA